MDANEYKDYLLGIVFYKYLSDSFLIKVYDLIYDEKPESLKIALGITVIRWIRYSVLYKVRISVFKAS